MIAACFNHVWQSTLFAIAAGLMTLIFRSNGAHVRYWLWLSASLKFLLPFSLLILAGNSLKQSPAMERIAVAAQSLPVAEVSRPFPDVVPRSSRAAHWAPVAVVCVWECGFLGVLWMRFRGWRRIRAMVGRSTRMDLSAGVEIRTVSAESRGLFEPGVVGMVRPILLVPEDIQRRLSEAQWRTVLEHELCHIRRHDNLTSAIHMLVEALFWFHPLVWWIGARLMDERERACDEAVLRSGADPRSYVDAILAVCASYLEPPLPSMPGVTGSNLKRRIQVILAAHAPAGLSWAKKAALAVGALGVLAAPVAIGMLNSVPVRAAAPSKQLQVTELPARPQPVAIAANRERASEWLEGLGNVTAYSVTVRPRVDGQLMSVNFREGEAVQAGQLLATLDARQYEIQLAQAEAQYAADERASYGGREEHDARLKLSEINVERAKLQMGYTQVTAPITGIAGLRQVDVGNVVRTGDAGGLVVITQLQPIAVVFTIPEDAIQAVMRRQRSGVVVPVEAWSRDNRRKYATGHLIAVDNQIDNTSGTVRLKAEFDNQDKALFPNQFVIVRLSMGAR